ncbi:MAG: S24 family peptidase [Patescibacteria group bacterium]
MNETYPLQLAAFYKKHKRMPGYKEFMQIYGFKSKNAVFKLINRLADAGVVIKDKYGKLSPGNIFGEVKVLGVVEAGLPALAEEELYDTINFNDYLVENKGVSYLLKVKGDSMIDAGIMPNDMVLVERGDEPRDGDIVIAEVDRDWTMKYFKKRNGKSYLEPANKKYEPIFPKEELKIAAIVKAVVRKY